LINLAAVPAIHFHLELKVLDVLSPWRIFLQKEEPFTGQFLLVHAKPTSTPANNGIQCTGIYVSFEAGCKKMTV
jgi:hypothetical protein